MFINTQCYALYLGNNVSKDLVVHQGDLPQDIVQRFITYNGLPKSVLKVLTDVIETKLQAIRKKKASSRQSQVWCPYTRKVFCRNQGPRILKKLL